MNPPTETTLIQHNTLSKKDQSIKDKFFSNKQVTPKPHPNPKPPSTSFTKAFEAPSQVQIDGFLQKMEKEFQKTNESYKINPLFFLKKHF